MHRSGREGNKKATEVNGSFTIRIYIVCRSIADEPKETTSFDITSQETELEITAPPGLNLPLIIGASASAGVLVLLLTVVLVPVLCLAKKSRRRKNDITHFKSRKSKITAISVPPLPGLRWVNCLRTYRGCNYHEASEATASLLKFYLCESWSWIRLQISYTLVPRPFFHMLYVYTREEKGPGDEAILKLGTKTKRSTGFRNPKALGCSDSSAVRTLLRAWGFLKPVDPVVLIRLYRLAIIYVI